jgi:hypothetical protein
MLRHWLCIFNNTGDCKTRLATQISTGDIDNSNITHLVRPIQNGFMAYSFLSSEISMLSSVFPSKSLPLNTVFNTRLPPTNHVSDIVSLHFLSWSWF